jgi:two-component sensor histidine kinase
MELSRAPDVSSLCRRAVELCVQRLGFDRIGIWFLDPEDASFVIGAWGTDEEGRPRDEHGIRLPRYTKDHPTALYDGSLPFVIVRGDVVFGEKLNPVGRSDKAIAPLWDGLKIVGEIVADNLLSTRGIEDEDGEVLALFARTVAHLCALKRSEAALREALEAKTFLLGELQHRTMNSFAQMQSLISIEAGRMPDSASKEILKKLKNRIKVLSLIYRQLDLSSKLEHAMLDEYLRRIAIDLFDGYGAEMRGISLVCDLEPMEVNTKRAVSLGLIVNELITDALKHAFPDGRTGVITLTLHRHDKETVLTVSDDGVGLPEGFRLDSAQGVGLTIVEALRHQLGGSLEAASTPGACFTLRFCL